MANRRDSRPVDRSKIDGALGSLVTDVRQFVYETVREKDPGVLDRVHPASRGNLKKIEDITECRDPTALLAVLLAMLERESEPVVEVPGVSFGLVDRVRNIRNDLFHYDRELTSEDLRAIENLRGLLKSAAAERRKSASARRPQARPRTERRERVSKGPSVVRDSRPEPRPGRRRRGWRWVGVAFGAAVLLFAILMVVGALTYVEEPAPVRVSAAAIPSPTSEDYYLRGQAHLDAGRLEPAIAQFREALHRDAGHRAALAGLASAHLQRGIDWARRSDHALAVDDYNAAVTLEPDNATAYLARGMSYRELGNYQQAAADFASAGDPREYTVTLQRWASDLTQEGRYEDAIAVYGRLWAVDGARAAASAGLVDVHLRRGRAHQANGDIDAAIADYGAVLELEPEHGNAHLSMAEARFLRGSALYEQGESEGAIADLTAALEHDPTSAAAWRQRGIVHYDRRELEPAHHDIAAAVRLDPANATGHAVLAKVLLELGNHHGALSAWGEALRLDPQNAEASDGMADSHAGRGNTLLEAGDREGAGAAFEQSLALAPGHPGARSGLARVRLAEGDAHMKAAMELYDQTDTKDGPGTREIRERVFVISAMAVEDYDQAVELDPDHADAWRKRGLAKYYHAGPIVPNIDGSYWRALRARDHARYQQAIADLDRAVAIDVGDARAYLWRGQARLGTGQDADGRAIEGNYRLAIEDFTKAIELERLSAEAYFYRAFAYRRLNLHTESMHDVAVVRQLGGWPSGG